MIRIGHTSVDFDTRTVWRGTDSERLPRQEAAVLEVLSARAGLTVSRERIRVAVWGRSGDQRTVDNVIRRLRKRFEADPHQPTHVLTVPGEGYRLVGTAAAPGVARAPSQPTFGRETELQEIAEAGQRLVTITGGPGMGKSHLAAEAVWRAPPGPGGVWYVEVTPLVSVDDVVQQLAVQLQVVLGDDPLGSLAVALGSRPETTLLLDGCEGLAEPLGGAVVRLLESAPRLRILATSRVPLGVSWETRVRLGPLRPAAALILYRERAQTSSRVGPSAALLDSLHGWPLAIVLAAGWKGEELPTALSSPLETAIDRSWGLLDAACQTALTHLTVFAGAMELEALQFVSEASLDTVDALFDAGMLRSHPGAHGRRFSLFDAVRDYVLSGSDAGSSRGAESRHASWYARLAPGCEQAQTTPGWQEYRLSHQADLPDVRRATERAPDARTALRCMQAAFHLAQIDAEAPAWTWPLAERLIDSEELTDRERGWAAGIAMSGVELGSPSCSAMLADVRRRIGPGADRLCGLWQLRAIHAQIVGDGEAAFHAARQASEYAADFGQQMSALITLGRMYHDTPNRREGREPLRRAASIAREACVPELEAHALRGLLINLVVSGVFDEAQQIAERLREAGKLAGMPEVEVWVDGLLGYASVTQGSNSAAVAMLTRALEKADALGVRRLVPTLYHKRAEATWATDPSAAEADLEAARAVAGPGLWVPILAAARAEARLASGDVQGAERLLTGLPATDAVREYGRLDYRRGLIALAHGDPQLALSHLEAGRAFVADRGYPPRGELSVVLDRLADLLEADGPSAFL